MTAKNQSTPPLNCSAMWLPFPHQLLIDELTLPQKRELCIFLYSTKGCLNLDTHHTKCPFHTTSFTEIKKKNQACIIVFSFFFLEKKCSNFFICMQFFYFSQNYHKMVDLTSLEHVYVYFSRNTCKRKK